MAFTDSTAIMWFACWDTPATATTSWFLINIMAIESRMILADSLLIAFCTDRSFANVRWPLLLMEAIKVTFNSTVELRAYGLCHLALSRM